jgi:hypothetical protein
VCRECGRSTHCRLRPELFSFGAKGLSGGPDNRLSPGVLGRCSTECAKLAMVSLEYASDHLMDGVTSLASSERPLQDRLQVAWEDHVQMLWMKPCLTTDLLHDLRDFWHRYTAPSDDRTSTNLRALTRDEVQSAHRPAHYPFGSNHCGGIAESSGRTTGQTRRSRIRRPDPVIGDAPRTPRQRSITGSV